MYGRFFIVETDHQALTTLQRKVIMQKDPNSCFMRWSMALQEYHYKILYKKGVNNGNLMASQGAHMRTTHQVTGTTNRRRSRAIEPENS